MSICEQCVGQNELQDTQSRSVDIRDRRGMVLGVRGTVCVLSEREQEMSGFMKIYGAAALMALPLLAGTAATASAASNGAMMASGSLEQSHGDWRSSKLVGATVYNSQGDTIGTIDDMLLGSNGKVSNVTISVGGFLGVGSKMVEVPFSKLKFEPSKSNSNSGGKADNAVNTVAAGNANGQDYSVVLPNVSKDALNSMSSFNY